MCGQIAKKISRDEFNGRRMTSGLRSLLVTSFSRAQGVYDRLIRDDEEGLSLPF